ncbi:MAG: hypothetical protein K2X55_12015 [Burkholderiaceae bacterium]|nr:hypothetical protein [Burkholderiaceae bacterium]
MSVIDAVPTAPSAEIFRAASIYVTGASTVSDAFLCLFAVFAALRFGYENKFHTELVAAVRRQMQMVTVGRMMLVPEQAFRSA